MQIPRITIKPANAARFAGNLDRNWASIFDGACTTHRSRDTYGARQRHRQGTDAMIRSVVITNTQQGECVLELGCNSGETNFLWLADWKFRMYGLDLEKNCLRRLVQLAKECKIPKRYITVKQWDFAENGELPWDMKGKFKVIYAVHVMSHLSSPQFIKTMQKMAEYLAPGGLITISNIKPIGSETFQHAMEIGGVCHDAQTIAEAFKGLERRKEYSRPFKKGELQFWDLPADRLEWLTFQKPA